MMGRTTAQVADVPCDNVVALAGNNASITKSGTSKTIDDAHARYIGDIKYRVSPVVKVSLKIQDEKLYTALLGALEKMESAGGLCYEILTLFWYHGKSMAEIAGQLGYANAETTKQQKARCQKRLRQMAHRELTTEQ